MLIFHLSLSRRSAQSGWHMSISTELRVKVGSFGDHDQSHYFDRAHVCQRIFAGNCRRRAVLASGEACRASVPSSPLLNL